MGSEENKYLAFNLGKESYGMPIMNVREIMGMVEITHVPKMPDFVNGVMNLRGKIVPVIDLSVKFGLPRSEYTSHTCVVVAEMRVASALHVAGLIVDEVSEVLDITDGCIEPVPTYGIGQIDQDFISSVGKVNDQIILLLNVEKIFSFSEINSMNDMAAEAN